jgi:drug/metabolite transporter (DMT)-like permease
MLSTILLIISTVLWGVWGYVNKLAVNNAHPLNVQWMYYIPSIILIPVLYLIGSRTSPETSMNGEAFKWAAVSGVAAAGAALLYFFALSDTSPSIATAVTAAYPVVTLVIGAALGEETIDLRKIVGIGIIIVGIVVLQWEVK